MWIIKQNSRISNAKLNPYGQTWPQYSYFGQKA